MNEENKENVNSSCGLYVHVPFCDGKCSYCAFYSIPYQTHTADRYLSALETEFIAFQKFAPETIYIGGGTPSMLSIQQLERLCVIIRHHLSFSRLKEWSVEMNPSSISPGKMSTLVQAGVNRISLGAQSFDDNILRWLGRRHSKNDTIKAVDMIRAAGIENLCLDLLACIPGFGEKYWQTTLDQAIALGSEHMSVYELTREKGTQLNRAVDLGKVTMLSEQKQLDSLNKAEYLLTKAGYNRYEISNYAKPGFECRHHVSCWRGKQYLGLGPAASSNIGLERWTNRPDIALYLSALEQHQPPSREKETLTQELKTIECLVFGLRMTEGVSAETSEGYEKTLQALQIKGLAVKQNNRWQLTPHGRNMADYVAVELMQT